MSGGLGEQWDEKRRQNIQFIETLAHRLKVDSREILDQYNRQQSALHQHHGERMDAMDGSIQTQQEILGHIVTEQAEQREQIGDIASKQDRIIDLIQPLDAVDKIDTSVRKLVKSGIVRLAIGAWLVLVAASHADLAAVKSAIGISKGAP